MYRICRFGLSAQRRSSPALIFEIMKRLTAFTIILALLSACQENNKKSDANAAVSFSRDSLLEDIRILASDSFQGRKPFTKGEDLTVSFLTNKFQSFGLEPGNGNSFVQEVPLVEITPNPAAELLISAPKGNFKLKSRQDYVLTTQDTDSVVRWDNDELIFAGYGVVAPEYNWNDYAGIDVKGKIVLVMVNDPGFGTADSSLFKGKAMTYYGRWTYKYEEAARQGAKGCLIIHNTAAASYPFSVVQNSWGSSNLYMDSRQSPSYNVPLKGWITGSAAKKILAGAGKDTSLLASANKHGFRAVSLNERLTTSVKIQARFQNSQNVIAKLVGTKRPEEYIIYTAHWDHFGVGSADSTGDTIYNGAMDNASGTAALLEMARAFAHLDTKPERSILFLAVTAEEQGLLGSDYYSQHPVYPLEKTVANLNMDVMNSGERTKDVVISGRGQNTLEDYVDSAAHRQGRYIAPDSHSEGGGYFRSDHFSFAKRGVPSLSMGSGDDVVGKGKEYGKKIGAIYGELHYHQPSDEFDSTWTFDGGLEDMKLLYNIGLTLGNETTWPKWNEGSEFKAIREKKK